MITWNEFKTLIEHTTVFFTEIAPKKTWKDVIVLDIIQTYVGMSMMIAVYAVLFSFIAESELSGTETGLIVIGAVLLVPLCSIIATFMIALITHGILKVIKGKG